MAWKLSDIRNRIRKVTGRFSGNELSNDTLDDYINRFVQYVLPAELKLERVHTYYEFLTSANQKYYDYPEEYVNFEPPAYADNGELYWYQDPALFYATYPESIDRVTIGTGDGSTTGFSYTISGTPIMAGTAVITDDTENFRDTNTDYTTSSVNLTGDAGGTATLNYSTGTVSVTFNSAPASGQEIVFSYTQIASGIPSAILAYDHKFALLPVPDTAYRIKMKAYGDRMVKSASGALQSSFQSATDEPLLAQWGPCIVFGVSRDIYADSGEMDGYAEVTALYKEQLAYAMKRTNQNLLNARAEPRF